MKIFKFFYLILAFSIGSCQAFSWDLASSVGPFFADCYNKGTQWLSTNKTLAISFVGGAALFGWYKIRRDKEVDRLESTINKTAGLIKQYEGQQKEKEDQYILQLSQTEKEKQGIGQQRQELEMAQKQLSQLHSQLATAANQEVQIGKLQAEKERIEELLDNKSKECLEAQSKYEQEQKRFQQLAQEKGQEADKRSDLITLLGLTQKRHNEQEVRLANANKKLRPEYFGQQKKYFQLQEDFNDTKKSLQTANEELESKYAIKVRELALLQQAYTEDEKNYKKKSNLVTLLRSAAKHNKRQKIKLENTNKQLLGKNAKKQEKYFKLQQELDQVKNDHESLKNMLDVCSTEATATAANLNLSFSQS